MSKLPRKLRTMPNTPKLSEDVEKDLVGENEHSVYTYCLNGCRTWGVNTPLNRVCGNCNEPDGLVYYDSETITKYVNKELATLKAQVRKEIEELGKQNYASKPADRVEEIDERAYGAAITDCLSIPSLKEEE